ncbi:helix-turn-helix domain-containing protein [uncultured Jannaschia sp.]|uniref:helix-turn-helix domain-containing protein n=1 Tax=uncultured Jannaschia sp. TaxID=293347 RepID=UPI0026077C6D|nr:helix-turn-helix domain-containing protein [uncultured Jannaschia sp.]
MRAETTPHPPQPFRPRAHATLPENSTKSSLLKLVSAVAHLIGLNATDLRVLARIAQKTRALDYADPARSPVCFERQIDMAASIGLSPEQWRRIERKLERLGLIARETAANGHRGRVSGSIGLESCAGLSLEPLIARLDELRATEARHVEEGERLATVRLEISKTRRKLKRFETDLGDHPLVAQLASERAAWVSPRSFPNLASAEAHHRALEGLVDKVRKTMSLPSQVTGAAVTDDRCHIQSRSKTLSESCRISDGSDEGRKKRRGASDADVNERFIVCLTVAKLRYLASDDLRFYIDGAPGGGRGAAPTLSDIEWAMLRRLRDLDIHPSAFKEAVEAMGWLRAMLAVMVIDRNREHPTRPIQSCGGALRAFTRRHLQGALDLRASISGIWGREGRVP